jgi:hypothetical protein
MSYRLPYRLPPCRYEVRKKKKGCVDEMAELVLSKFTTRVQAGNKHSWSVQVRRLMFGRAITCGGA